MKASLGIPHGHQARPYHPKIFQNHEEVIVYEREEFRRNYNQIRENINHIILTNLEINCEEDWKLMGRTDYIVNKINSVIDKIKRDKQLHANYIDSIKIFTKTTTVKSKSASKKSMK